MRNDNDDFSMYSSYDDFGGDAISQNEQLANFINPTNSVFQPVGEAAVSQQQQTAQSNPVSQTSQVAATPAKTDYTQALTNQILGQGLTGKWTGQGFGSAEANAADMAKILAGIGITDIKDFGKITKTIPAHEEFQPGASEGDSGSMVTVPEQTITTYGNKVTGQEVPNTYSERQKDNFFGGTFSGKGNTGYGVQFDQQGNPYFYTQGASSNDLVNLFKDNPILGTIAQVGAAYFGGPVGTAALAAAMGKDPVDILKSAALSYAGGQAANAVSGIEGIKDILGSTGTDIAANTAKQVVGSGGKVDPVQALLGNVVNTGVDSLTSGLPDMGDLLPKELKGVAGDVAKAVISGKPLDQALAGSLTRQALNSSGASDTTVSSDTKPDFIDTEKARLANEGVSKSDVKNYLNNLERLTEELDYEPAKILDTTSTAGTTGGSETATSSPVTSTASSGAKTEEADDFLKSIGINTIDQSTDSGLSNQAIENIINGGGNDTVNVTGNRDTVGKGMSNDIIQNLENAKADEGVVVTGNRDTFGKGMSNDIIQNLENAKADEGVVITGNKDKTKESVFDPTFGGTMPIRNGEIVDGYGGDGEIVITGDRDKKGETIFDPTFGGTLPLPETPPVTKEPETKTETPVTKTIVDPVKPAVKPAVKPETNPFDLMSLLALLDSGQQAPQMPRKKNSAEIELMKDIFGSTLNFD